MLGVKVVFVLVGDPNVPALGDALHEPLPLDVAVTETAVEPQEEYGPRTEAVAAALTVTEMTAPGDVSHPLPDELTMA